MIAHDVAAAHDAAAADPAVAFEVVRRPDYPRLAWLFELGERPRAHCGADVEVFRDGLVEGCWGGRFGDFDFAGRVDFFGSGVVARRGGASWLFCPPCHTCDALYALDHRGRRYVANSLVILFEHAGLTPDPRHNYTRSLITLTNGLDQAETLVWRTADVALHRLLGDDFTFDGDGPPRRERRREAASFPDYAAYHRHLLDTVAACLRNAADPVRRHRTYAPVTTCSGGYDSNAVAALAAEAGCRLAVTFGSARGGGDDSGRPVAESLGMPCVERGRPGRDTGGAEAEFLATGTGGGESPFAAFEEELRGAVLLSGHYGDKIWERSVPPGTDLRRTAPSGCSLADFRLRVGFLHVPAPFVGARRHPDVHAISNSAEMRPFSVGGGYDRPVCRRILEEAGVPRALVGRSKRAVATWFSWGPGQLSPEARASFEAFLRGQGDARRVRLGLLGFQAGSVAFRCLRKGIKLVPTLERPLGGLRDRLDPLFRSSENSRYANLLFVWALGRMLELRAAARPSDARVA